MENKDEIFSFEASIERSQDVQQNVEKESPQNIERYADILRNDAYPMYLWGINRGLPLGDAPLASLRKYIDDFTKDLLGENGNDPLVRILIEQLLLSHQVIGRLCCDAVDKPDVDVRRTNLQLATTLMGEARRQTKELMQIGKSAKGKTPPQSVAMKKGRGAGGKVVSKQEPASTKSKFAVA